MFREDFTHMCGTFHSMKALTTTNKREGAENQRNVKASSVVTMGNPEIAVSELGIVPGLKLMFDTLMQSLDCCFS